ncbi:MAG TPA: hypothetical protein VFH78_09805 [Candidatus Thermoplasmatota archaeon]|nr:hypothetical protein [Candidatus Thermoplasmatota archaeon]
MLGRVLSATAVILLASLAGCISKGDEAPEDDAQTRTSQNVLDPNASTEAPDGRGQISAFQETNRTESGMGAMHHTHDYWEGKERLDDVAWIDSGLIPIPFLPCKKPGGGCTVGDTMPGSDTYPALTTIADYDLAPPPEMGMIYEGTKYVELTMKEYSGPFVAPGNPAGKVFFDYLAANDEAGAFRTGGELKLNEPFRIEIEPTMADMPHQAKSLWIFRIYSNSEMVWFEFNITISLVKGYDVVNWPPHPDLYADNPTRTVFEGPVHLESKGTIDSYAFGTDAGWVSPQRVISWNTDRVEVTVSGVQFSGQVPIEPDGFVLEYHNASDPFLLGNGAPGARLMDPGSDGSTYTFVIDLTKDRGDAYDTPYAQYSRWGFRLVPYWGDGMTESGCVDEMFWPGILFGCQWYPWSMDYTMTIKATGRPAAPEPTTA